MEQPSPRKSERANKGVPPQRFYMNSQGAQNPPVTTMSPPVTQPPATQTSARQPSATEAAAMQPPATQTPAMQPPATQTSSKATTSSMANIQNASNVQQQQSRVQTDILKTLGELMRQVNAMQTFMVTQRQETNASIAALEQQVKYVSLKATDGGVTDSESRSSDGMYSGATGMDVDNGSVRLNDNMMINNDNTVNRVDSLTNFSSHSQGTASYRAKVYPLPKFSGLPEEWPTFIEDFRQTTAEFEYSPLQNIIRIREALHGNAKETVESLLSSSQNVEVIIETLKQSYGRPEQLIRSQIEKVCALSFVPEGKLDLLVKFSTKVANMVRFLKTANGTHHLNNPSLLSELVSKLPPTKQMQWAEKCISLDRPVDLMDFCNWLENVKKVANMVSDTLPTAYRNKKPESKNKFVLTTTTNSAKNCLVCSKSNHLLTECQVFKSLIVDDRWKKARELRVCFSCLKGHHQVSKCFKKQHCGINGCEKMHHGLLHNSSNGTTDRNNIDNENISVSNSRQRQGAATESENEIPRRNLHAGTDKNEILFQIIPVTLYGPNKSISIYAFIDDGADATMLEWDVGKQIGLVGKQDKLKLQWLNGHCSSQPTEMVNAVISGTQEASAKYKISKIYMVKNLELPTQSFSVNDVKRSGHLENLPIEDYYQIKPQMIISLTHAFLTVPMETPRCLDGNGPIAVKTRLGWVVYGPTGTENEHATKSVFHSRIQNSETEMNEIMRNYFDVESCMVKLDAKPVVSKEEERALNILKSTTRCCGSRFECGLLWKSEVRSFPNTYASALRRFQLIEKKFKSNEKYENDYRSKMKHLLDEGYARRLSSEEEKCIRSTTFFLPHFGVSNPSKDSLRLVFDAAAKVQGTSLNDFLLPGPDLNQTLLGVLFKFRERPVAVCGDLKEMFLQVAIRKEDQDAQRFLYRENESQPIAQYVMTRAIFGATCSPTIAQYVKNFNAERFIDRNSRAVEAIVKRHYVDDYADCFSTVEEAIKVLEEVIKIHGEGGFVMHKILSNSEEINKHFGNSNMKNINITADDIEKILGMQWSPAADEFVFGLQFKPVDSDILERKRVPTKRKVLSLIMSVFDPFGFLGDFTISGKILMQLLWKAGIGWDEDIPEALYDRWENWLCGLDKVSDFHISRCYFYDINQPKRTLHVFCDASELAMAVVAYWRFETSSGVEISFVAGKTNCAPTKFMTIPRLELQAAVFAVRLKNNIVKFHNMSPSEVWFWSDSSTVIKWITSDHRRYKQFVANRVAEILESSLEKEWRWVPGDMNPADEGTRPSASYDPNGRWKTGPYFLKRPPELWPTKTETPGVDKCDEELRQSHIVLSTQVKNNKIFNINHFSKYLRYKRCVGWVFRFCNNIRQKRDKLALTTGDLTLEEEEHAERCIIRFAQREEFEGEFECLSKRMPILSSSSIVTLNPYIDESGNLRCGGRIDNAPFITSATKIPYILPKDCHLTHLIVQWYHERQNHINDQTVICEIRLKYWIPAIRMALKRVKSACHMCKLRRCKPVQPIMGPLPRDRLCAFVRPFSYTGLDYFGPLTVSVRRSQEKRWIALFTCLTTRAVHLEIATNLSSDACLLCIRNFINRRGIPVQMRSDNGTNFIGLQKELGNEEHFIDFDQITEGLKPLGIKWKFNTPVDPSAGGAWERLVQSVKRALTASLKEQSPRPETLYSLLIECENMVNSRPLTHLPVTPEEPEPLTPNHFLLGCSNSTQTPAPFDPKLCSLRKQWRILQNLKNALWNRWMVEYLPELTRRTKWCRPSKPIAAGALVLICDPDQPRSKWKRGRVLRLMMGQDGVARSAEVSTVAGSFRRPISRLAVLDVQDCGEVDRVGPFTEEGMSVTEFP